MVSPELREFDFLPELPKVRLDDRGFEDLVQECILRIPRYCPEWTNHNPGDPGITLIELFAWLVDQMLQRFNQVPRRHYIAFLELLGMQLQPPTVAQVDLTFYLVRALNSPYRIPINTEVATVRTETEPAVVFTTDTDLVIGKPRIQALLTAELPTESTPDLAERLTPESSSRFIDTAVMHEIYELEGDLSEEVVLFPTCRPGNCFYLVLTPTHAASSNGSSEPVTDNIVGNVIALNFRGSIAETTNIDPSNPPLEWQVWNGDRWQGGILRRGDDQTGGFSFHELQRQGQNPEGADVILHLPPNLVEAAFGNYQGYWVRCVYQQKTFNQLGYSRSPRVNHLSVRSIGGTISASECVRIENEFLGVSDGKPGQVFQLQNAPVLARSPAEHLWIKLPADQGEQLRSPEDWQEVADFGDSDGNTPHYLLNSQTGTIQFGPLVREPTQLQQLIRERERNQLQPWGKTIRGRSTGTLSLPDTLDLPLSSSDSRNAQYQEWQYGRIPPPGAEIYMSAYRVGGGSRGNVAAGKLVVLKTAIPYVREVRNHQAAVNGKDSESLDEMVLRVPQVLRTSRVAVTPEDFVNTVEQAHAEIYRAYCPPIQPERGDAPGTVRLLLVVNPSEQHNSRQIEFQQEYPQGMVPDRDLVVSAKLKNAVLQTLEKRKPLGIQLLLDTPEYVGVKVKATLRLKPQYEREPLRQASREKLQSILYHFLNPITGGFDRQGWALGQAVGEMDIVALLQSVPEVGFVGRVQLFRVEYHPQQGWVRSRFAEPAIAPSSLGLLCSWGNHSNTANLDSAHELNWMESAVP